MITALSQIFFKLLFQEQYFSFAIHKASSPLQQLYETSWFLQRFKEHCMKPAKVVCQQIKKPKFCNVPKDLKRILFAFNGSTLWPNTYAPTRRLFKFSRNLDGFKFAFVNIILEKMRYYFCRPSLVSVRVKPSCK